MDALKDRKANINQIISLINKYNIDVNQKNKKDLDRPIIYYITLYGSIIDLKLFLKQYKDRLEINTVESDRLGALQIAIFKAGNMQNFHNHFLKKASILVNYGADINIKSKYHHTALSYTLYQISKNKNRDLNIKVAMYILDNFQSQIDPTIQVKWDKQNLSALDMATLLGLNSIVQKILKSPYIKYSHIKNAYSLIQTEKEKIEEKNRSNNLEDYEYDKYVNVSMTLEEEMKKWSIK